MPKPEIFFSYAWADNTEEGYDREKIVNELYESLRRDRYTVVRDKYDVGYRGNIKAFMERLGSAAIIIVVISDKYLKSHNCMFELLTIYRRSNSDADEMKKKIFPLFLDDVKIFDGLQISNHTTFWENKHRELEEEIRKGGSNRAEISGDLSTYREIASNTARLMGILADMNASDLAKILANDFSELKKSIDIHFDELRRRRPLPVFNEILTRSLMVGMAEYNEEASAFLKDASGNYDNWERDTDTSNLAKNLISSAFPGTLGTQFSRLWAIGKTKTDDIDNKHATYLENCFHLTKMTLQLLSFAFISRLWDYEINKLFIIPKKELEIIRKFFERTIAPGFDRYLILLQALVSIFEAFPQEAPFTEFADLHEATNPDSNFVKAIENLQAIKKEMEVIEISFETCLEAEKELSSFFSSLAFLTGYKMVSIKDISYYALRNTIPHYLHNYTELGLDRKQRSNIERIHYLDIPGNIDAIFLFKLDYWKGTNLFPFMLNMNALNLEGSAKLYFYSNISFDGQSLDYYSWEDNSIENISATGMDIAGGPSQLISDREGIKNLKRNIVLWQFAEAKKIIIENATGTLSNSA
ncbi:toll/interleukin-1 receptor domain-containing protein [Flavitalea sp.]|nr:toll/interleukin-1 receptor domain-containing protein [Flavitalea sp.]